MFAFYLGCVIALQCEENIPDDVWLTVLIAGVVISSVATIILKRLQMKEIKNTKTIKSVRGSSYDLEKEESQH